jgi:L-alanine-DL-glutamate epimerase-like enolase superfamily enzyme
MREILDGDLRIESVAARPLCVPLVEPFVIASGRLDATRAVEVEVRLNWNGRQAMGLGESACLPPVTREDQPDVLRAIDDAAPSLLGRALPANFGALEGALGEVFPDFPVARAGVETALLDAMARVASLPLRAFLDGERGARTVALETDVTVAIAEPERMLRLARAWRARGFRALKLKVGANVDAEAGALEAIGRALPGVRLRVDANGGFSAREAIDLGRSCERLGLAVECWEQPCAADDLDAIAKVADALTAPVIADESVKNYDDLLALVGRADGVNLKLAKMGGVLAAYRIGTAAQARGFKLMAGGMVETRLGMTAAAHVACALGGVDFVDLDTAWLLESDPYEGGYRADGPRYTMPLTPGLSVDRRL